MSRYLPVVLLVLTVPTSLATAGYPPDPDFNANLYLTSPDYAGCSVFDDGEVMFCDNLRSDPIQEIAFLWIVASHLDGFPIGIGGFEWGIEHSNISVVGWNLCTGGNQLTAQGWPASGGVIAVTWEFGCYNPPGEVAKVGYFTIEDGDAGFMKIIDTGFFQDAAAWADCIPDVYFIEPEQLGSDDLAEGTAPDCAGNPTLVVEASWSSIKGMYR